MGSNRRWIVKNHWDEYLVDRGIIADEYRVLVVFEGNRLDCNIVFECPVRYRIFTIICDRFFLGNRLDNLL